MVERKKEKDDAPQVDSLLIETAFHSLVAVLGSRGELRGRESGTEIVADGPDGVKISVVSPFNQERLRVLSRVSGQRMEDIVLESALRVRVSTETATEDNELILVEFDPAQLVWLPEDVEERRKALEGGVQYSIKGRGTPEDLTARVKKLIS